MSVLSHPCLDAACRHPDFFHDARSAGVVCSHGWCRCTRPKFAEQPVLMPRFGPHGEKITEVVEPGGRWGAAMHGHVACDCSACRAEYARLTAGPTAKAGS